MVIHQPANVALLIISLLAGAMFIASIPYLVRTLLAKDRFLGRLYAEYPELWVQLGKPWGWLWHPPGKASSQRAALPLSGSAEFGWLSKTKPTWLDSYPSLVADYDYLRGRIRVWNFKLMPLFFGLVGLACLAGFSASR